MAAISTTAEREAAAQRTARVTPADTGSEISRGSAWGIGRGRGGRPVGAKNRPPAEETPEQVGARRAAREAAEYREVAGGVYAAYFALIAEGQAKHRIFEIWTAPDGRHEIVLPGREPQNAALFDPLKRFTRLNSGHWREEQLTKKFRASDGRYVGALAAEDYTAHSSQDRNGSSSGD